MPELPYTVEDLPFGPFVRPTRRYPSGRYGEILSDDEIKVWAILQSLLGPPPVINARLCDDVREWLEEDGEEEDSPAEPGEVPKRGRGRPKGSKNARLHPPPAGPDGTPEPAVPGAGS